MIHTKNCKEKAIEWGVSSRSVNDMCKKGRIQGAIKEKGVWLIPDDAKKPVDGRVSNGKYVKKAQNAKLKSLPIGISDYVRAQSEYYYESMMYQEYEVMHEKRNLHKNRFLKREETPVEEWKSSCFSDRENGLQLRFAFLHQSYKKPGNY